MNGDVEGASRRIAAAAAVVAAAGLASGEAVVGEQRSCSVEVGMTSEACYHVVAERQCSYYGSVAAPGY